MAQTGLPALRHIAYAEMGGYLTGMRLGGGRMREMPVCPAKQSPLGQCETSPVVVWDEMFVCREE